MAALLNSRYRVVGTLGEHAQGGVFLVEDTLFGNARAALKTIRGGNLDDMLLKNLRAEFYTLSRFKHPCIAQVYDVGRINSSVLGEYDGALFFTLEYIEGPDLFRFTETTDWHSIASLVFQIAHALEYIHRHGLIHFDIKPANIIVTDAGQGGGGGLVKLIDFGFASPLLESSGQPLRGTLEYIAPELLRGDAYDHRVDLYALGVTLYEIIARQTPFRGESATGTVKLHLSAQAPALRDAAPGMPAFFAELVERLLQKEPGDRFESAAAVVHFLRDRYPVEYPLQNVLDHVPIHRLVGRESDVQHLTDGITKRLADERIAPEHGSIAHPTVTFITGESGIGKTALLREVELRSRTNGILFFDTRCFDRNSLPYDPFLNLLRDQIAYAKSFGAEGDGFIQKHAEVLTRVYGTDTQAHTERIAQRIDDPEKRLHFVDMWSRLFFGLAAFSPFAMWIDKIDEADESSLELLAHLLRSAPRHRIKFFISGISSAAIAPLRQPLDAQDSEVVALPPLTETAAGELLAACLNAGDVPRGLAELLIERLGGSPSILHEFLSQYMGMPYADRALAIERDLRAPETHDAFADIILHAYRQKAAQRKPEELFLLRVLSCFDTPVSLTLLQQVSPFTPLRVKYFHDLLVNVGIIRSIENGSRCYFSQSGFKEFIHASLGGEKEMLHQLIADTMAAGTVAGADNAEVIARHYKAAGRPRSAYPFFVTAAAQNRSQYALNGSIALLNEACTLIPSEEVDIAVFESLADCYSLVGDYPHAVLLYEQLRIEAADESKRHNYAKELGRIHTREGRFDEAYALLLEASTLARTPDEIIGVEEELAIIDISRGRYADALDRCSRVLLEHSTGEAARAITGILNNLGIIHFYQNDPMESAACFRRSIEILQKDGHMAQLISPYLNLGNVYSAQERFAEAAQYWEHALVLSQEVGNLQQEARAYNNIGIALFNQGNGEEAAAQYEKAYDIFSRLGFLPGMALCLTNIGEMHFADARYQKALECWEKDLKLYESLHDEHGMIEISLHLASAHIIFGRADAAAALLDSAEVLLAGSANTAQMALFRYMKGQLCRERAARIEARTHLLAAVELYEGAKDRRGVCLASLALAEAELALGEIRRSADVLARVAELAAEHHYAAYHCESLIQLGIISGAGPTTDLEPPITYFSAAFEAIRSQTVTETTWHACYHLGKEYIRRGMHEKGVLYFEYALQALDYIASGIASQELRTEFFASHRRAELRGEMRSGICVMRGE